MVVVVVVVVVIVVRHKLYKLHTDLPGPGFFVLFATMSPRRDFEKAATPPLSRVESTCLPTALAVLYWPGPGSLLSFMPCHGREDEPKNAPDDLLDPKSEQRLPNDLPFLIGAFDPGPGYLPACRNWPSFTCDESGF
jgi:hypothetical protein